MKYTIDLHSIWFNGYTYSVNIKEKVTKTGSFGDQMGIDNDGFWFCIENIDFDNDYTEIKEFVKDYFNNYKVVLGIISRIK